MLEAATVTCRGAMLTLGDRKSGWSRFRIGATVGRVTMVMVVVRSIVSIVVRLSVTVVVSVIVATSVVVGETVAVAVKVLKFP